MQIHEYNRSEAFQKAHAAAAAWIATPHKSKFKYPSYRACFASCLKAEYRSQRESIEIPIFYNRFASSLQAAKMMN